MIACIVITAFFAFVTAKFFARHGYCAGGPRGWNPGWGHHRHHGGPWGRHGLSRRSRWIWAALARLDLSPAQEKVVRAELDTLKRRARGMREESSQTRADLARAVRGEEFEEGALASMFIRHDERLHDLRGDLAGALGRIHAVLDEDQRQRLADLLQRAPAGPWGGPYRGKDPGETAEL